MLVVIHYGTNYSGKTDQHGICGAKAGGKSARHLLTWRPYEIETDDHLGAYPLGSKVCAKCRDIVSTARLIESQREQRKREEDIRLAVDEIPRLWARREWLKISRIARSADAAAKKLRNEP